MVKKPSLVGAVIVTLASIARAPAGMVQLPFVPWTVNVAVSAGLRGVFRVPTVDGAGRVSTSRHGVIDTKIGRSPDDTVARTTPMPPAPSVTATAAPIAAHLIRPNPIMSRIGEWSHNTVMTSFVEGLS
jgi:hypothetical protein